MNNKKIAIIMVGAPGSGKGTQGELLIKNLNYKGYVMSSLIRQIVKSDNNISQKMASGALLSDNDIFKIFRQGFKFENEIVIDGIPRTLDQAYWLYGFLKNYGYEIKVIYLKIDENKLLQRILKRAKEENRVDDNIVVFKKRLEIFDTVRDAILQVFKKQTIEIDGDRTVEVISNDILNKLKGKDI